MKILITGVNGFVGGNLVPHLKINHIIYGLYNQSPLKEDVLATFRWDELDKIPLVDMVIHLAGKAHDTNNQTNTQVYFDINTGLTIKIYDWFLKSTATKFIFFSSVKAAADKVEEGVILDEDIIPSPKGPYGESKIAAERYVLKNLPSNKKVYILRPCMIHGPGNKGNLNLLFQLVQKRIPWPLGAFKNKRSFISSDNLNFVIEQLIENNIESGIYHIADDETISTNDLVQIINKAQNRNSIILSVPSIIIRSIAFIGDYLKLPLNSERLQKLTESYMVSNHKIKKALGIKKMPITVQEGLLKTIKDLFNSK